MKYLPLLTLFSITTLTSTGQSWLEKSLKKVAKEAATETTKSQTAKLDSIDFQFVMSVSEGSSMFEIEQKFETVSKTSSSLFKLLDDDEKKRAKTIQEIARDTLQAAIRLYEIRSYKLASEGFVNAKAYMEANDLKQELTYLRCITSLGIMYLVQGRNHDAAENITYALTQSSEVLGQKSAAYAANLNSQAKLDQLSGKYNEAEIAFDQVISIIQKIVGEKSMQYAIVLNNKALLYQVMGRFPESVELMKKSIAASEAAPKKVTQSGKKSFDNRKFLSNLAVTYQLSGNLPEAEKQYLYIKDIFETRMFQKGNSEYASLLNQLGVLYIQMGKMDQVENLLKKSAEECKKFFTNEENAAFAKTQNDLGNFYRIQGRFAEAETTLQKAVDIRKRVLGENHPDYVKSIENLGILYWKKGELEKAYTPLHEATDQSLNFINSYFPPMSETEKTKYWDVLQPRFQRFYNYAIEASASNPEVLKDVYNYQIATKALLLNSTNKIKKTILSSGDQSLIDTYLSWIAQKENLSRYYALSKEDLLQQKIDLVELEKTANNSERELSQRSSAFSQAFSSEKIDFTQVAAQLTDTESLLEFIRVRSFDKDFTNDARYLVLALTKNATEPKMVILQNGNQLETRYAKYYKNSIQQKTPDEFSYDQFWKGVDPLLTGKKTVYISPDGVYNQINLNTLKPKEGDYILNRYDLVIIGNSKDLIALKQRKVTTARKDAFLLGFPDYNGAAVPLPGTKIEVEGINKILQVAGYKTSLQEEKNASEANLKAVKGPALIHLATHGYFLADSDLQGGGDALGVNAENAKNNPLLRSGLILAGAKTNENKDVNLTSNDNGILTAYEAMSLNLEGTDLIILSACETGLGDVRAGEGVYGLQRSFLIAGANALVMSLWKVDDAATQQLMTNFYTNWTKGGSKLKAFKQAQQQLKLKFKEPYYWGAFVMMGM
jgi:CHAT domain-containing protein